MGYKKISKQLVEKLTTVGTILEKGRNAKSPAISLGLGSTQDLASWAINDNERGQGSALYYTGGAC